MHVVELLAYEWRYLTFRASAANSLVQVFSRQELGVFFVPTTFKSTVGSTQTDNGGVNVVRV
jgi:hypothetical protein